MNVPGGWELLLIVLVFMVIFGYKGLPKAAQSVGQSLRILKDTQKDLQSDSEHVDGDAHGRAA